MLRPTQLTGPPSSFSTGTTRRDICWSAGNFQIYLPQGIEIADAGYDRTDGIWTSGSVRSVGTIALSAIHFEIFQSIGLFVISGGAASFRSLDQLSYGQTELSHLDAFLSGTVTAGYGGQAEPGLGSSFVSVSQAPLPASGLLLGGVLLIGAGLRRRRPR